MDNEIESLFQKIGNQLLDLVGDSSPRVLAYAEAEDSVVSVSVFYIPESGNIPVFKFGGKALSDLFYNFWSVWYKNNKDSPWRSASYFIQDGKPTLEIVYADRFNENMSKIERRSGVVEKFLGSSKVDYSQS